MKLWSSCATDVFLFFYVIILCFHIFRFFLHFSLVVGENNWKMCFNRNFLQKNSISQLKLLNFCYFLLPASNQVPPSVSKRIKLQIHCKYKIRVSNFILVTISKQKCNHWKFKKKISDEIVLRKFACKTKPPKHGYYCTKTMSMFAHRKIFILNYWFISTIVWSSSEVNVNCLRLNQFCRSSPDWEGEREKTKIFRYILYIYSNMIGW